MATQLQTESGGAMIELRVEDRLTRQDYQRFAPELERRIRLHGKVRLLVDLVSFTGMDLGAVWEDLKFDVKHFNHIDRLAVVGDKRWHEWMARFSRPFTTAEVRYFDQTRAAEARAWLAA